MSAHGAAEALAAELMLPPAGGCGWDRLAPTAQDTAADGSADLFAVARKAPAPVIRCCSLQSSCVLPSMPTAPS
ncbi:hypothetical protein [Streptomyces sp. NPDC059928]|uniref:hypothetical protein n=1 Tax=unclassified Streptomyces TaxID=2593676 RepID=UPI00365601B2